MDPKGRNSEQQDYSEVETAESPESTTGKRRQKTPRWQLSQLTAADSLTKRLQRFENYKRNRDERLARRRRLARRPHKVDELNRKKDIVCLILSYPPMNSMNKERHKNWVRDVLKINEKVRRTKQMWSEVSSEAAALLNHSLDDIEAYVPPLIIQKMWEQTLMPITQIVDEKLHNLAVEFATRQILEGIENPDFRTISILGRDSNSTEKVISAVKDLPQIRRSFNTVIQVHDSRIHSIEDVEKIIRTKLGFSSSGIWMLDEYLKTKSFLIFLHDPHGRIDPNEMGSKWWNSNLNNVNQKIVCTINSQGSKAFDSKIVADLEIRLEDHLLSWELFCFNVGEIAHSSSSGLVQHRAVDVVEKCSGHLLLVVLMARALKMVLELGFREYAASSKSGVFCNAFDFILRRLGSADECVVYCAFYMERKGMGKVDLIQQWIEHALINTFDEGEKIVGDLVNGFFLESFQNGYSVRMPEEIREVLVNSHILLRGGKGLLTKAPRDEAWEVAFEMHLMDNKFSQLPNSPNCPLLSALFLQNNSFLRAIRPLFFQHMPMLQILDLSHTKIRSLPPSLFGLAQLQRLLLRGCKLLMKLPPEVGELNNLKVLDFEGTEIIRLPVEVGKLINLSCLKMSFYGENSNNDDRKDDQYQYYSNRIIPQNVVSNLLQLKELIIDVSPDDQRWNANVKDIVEEVCRLDRLKTLQIYLPEVLLLNELWNGLSSRNLSGMHFRFTVGSHLKRIISRVPPDIAAKFGEQERYLKYVNGECFPIEIGKILGEATALFLDRHSTATSLSEFGIETKENLKFCVLGECDEIQAIADADVNGYLSFGSLEYLHVYYMKNLRSIWKGKFPWLSLSCLKVLALYTCPQLKTIFTSSMIYSFYNLEELVVEDCPKIESLVEVSHDRSAAKPTLSFLKLKKISLHYLPSLVSISNGIIISPVLEWMSFHDCPSLKMLYPEEVHSKNLRTITGEPKWWEELKWNDSESYGPPNLDAIFVPIEWDKDLTTQLAEINVQHQARMQETEPSQHPGSGSGSVKISTFDTAEEDAALLLLH